MDELASLQALGQRFLGVDLSFRRNGTGWPHQWRASCCSSKHEGARATAYGATPEEAIAALKEAVLRAMS